ncbi:hypothetical protein HanPI659440_Chr03g0103371 [Helianthus annuus]|nr:hypothetical protein HanPI659440_Chr03g0103371 [Helianthus annuus]
MADLIFGFNDEVRALSNLDLDFRFFMNDDEDQVQLKIWATPVRFLSVKQWGDWVSSSVGAGFMLHIINVHTGEETLENNMECAEILGGDLSVFHLTTGAYYLCRRDFFELAEVCGLAPDWFRILVGDTIDYTDVRGWRKTGRPKQVNLSSIEVKTIRCIIHDPQLVSLLCYKLKGLGYHNVYKIYYM